MPRKHGVLGKEAVLKGPTVVRMSVNLVALENALLQKSVRFSGHFEELSSFYDTAKKASDKGEPLIFEGTVVEKGEVKAFYFKRPPVPGLTYIGTQLMDLVP